MIMQKPDVVGLLGGSLLEVSLGCWNDLKETGQSLPVGVAMERAEAACSDSSFCCPLALTSAGGLQSSREEM